MPLLDHFRPPLDPRCGWESFHHRWANAFADHLDRTLPPGLYARVEVHLGKDVAADVTEEEWLPPAGANGAGGVAVQTYTPPAATTVIPTVFPEEAAVEVRAADPGARLLGVVELVSPGNKQRPDARRAFVAKAVAYLRHGVGLVVVDAVTVSRFNLHDDVARELGGSDEFAMPDGPPTYAAAYRPAGNAVEAWAYPLAVGADLPTVPFYLRGHGCVPLDLEATYTDTRRRARC